MSHEITSTDYMVSAGSVLPWHKLGFVSDKPALTAIEALELAKLNWGVDKEEIFDADSTSLEEFRLLRRSDTREVLSVVPEKWTPLQNAQLLEIAEALAQAPGDGDFKPVIETAGSLKGGKVVWALVQTAQREFAGSKHKQFMLLSNGHYLGRGVRGTLTDVRVVCNNTLTAAENATCALFTSHFGDVEGRIEAAIQALEWATDATRSTFAIYEALAATRCTVDKAHKLFLGLYPKEVDAEGKEIVTDSVTEKVDRMVHLFSRGNGNSGYSYFDAVNAVTDFVDHDKDYKNTDGVDERRFLDVSFGLGAALKRKAVTMAKKELVLV